MKRKSTLAILLSTPTSGYTISPSNNKIPLFHSCPTCNTNTNRNIFFTTDPPTTTTTATPPKTKLTNKPSNNPLLSARKARIIHPLSSILILHSSPPTALAKTTTTTTTTSSSNTFQTSLQSHFPGSIPNTSTILRLQSTLRRRQYKPYNALLATSLCPDEINDTQRSLMGQLRQTIAVQNDGGVFHLGGLGGIPFVGETGWNAFLSHCPKGGDGKVLVLYGPHVGIGTGGEVGMVERIGVVEGSGCCGAVVKALNVLSSDVKKKKEEEGGGFDWQEDYIIDRLRDPFANLPSNIQDTNAKVAYITHEMYNIIQQTLRGQVFRSISNKSDIWNDVSEIVLVGGVVINSGKGSGTDNGEDYFQPLAMDLLTKDGEMDLYEEVFGDLGVPPKMRGEKGTSV